MNEYTGFPGFAHEVEAGFRAVWGSVSPPGRLLVGRVTGSRAYGTAGPDSDWDWSGVYLSPTARVLPKRYVTTSKSSSCKIGWRRWVCSPLVWPMKSGRRSE
jgi:hypothetical protein